MPAETHVEGTPIGRDEVLELIRDRLADILEIEPSEIAEGASFADDLDAVADAPARRVVRLVLADLEDRPAADGATFGALDGARPLTG